MITLINKLCAAVATVFFIVLAKVIAKILQAELNSVLLMLLVGLAFNILAELKDIKEGK